jgi:hypothetical protein
MIEDRIGTRVVETPRAAGAAALRTAWVVEAGLGRGLVARWHTTDERRRAPAVRGLTARRVPREASRS